MLDDAVASVHVHHAPVPEVELGNVPTGTCQVRLNALMNDFPFSPAVIGFGNFDPPVVHP